VEVERTLFEQWRGGDYSSTDWADPGIEFVMTTPGACTSQGLEAMQESWRDFLRASQEFRGAPEEIIDAGGRDHFGVRAVSSADVAGD
jgi:hypothetical protein